MKTILSRMVAVVLGVSLLAGGAVAADYDIDVTHSEVGFKVKHLAISKVRGKFDTFSGSFSFEPGKPETWSAQAEIQTGSVNTGNDNRDEHLRQDDFFDAANHPVMTFRSTGVEMTGDDEGVIKGELTIRGVTRPIELELEVHGTATDPWGNEKAGFTAEGKINRQEFGLSFNKVMESGGLVVGDEVTIVLEIEGNKRK